MSSSKPVSIILKVILAAVGSYVGIIAGAMLGSMVTANAFPSLDIAGAVGWEAGALVGGFIGIPFGALIGIILAKSFLKEHSKDSRATDIIIIVLVTIIVAGYQYMQFKKVQGEWNQTIEENRAAYPAGTWEYINTALRDAIYEGDVDAVMALTYPGAVNRATVESKMSVWRENRFQLGGSQTMLNEQTGVDATVSISGVPEDFKLKLIEGKWYLQVE